MAKMNKQNCSAIILAAGRSGRMGLPKFSLNFNENNTFLEEIVSKYLLFGCNQIIIILNEKGYDATKQSHNSQKNVLFVKNMNLEWERFYSIKLGAINLKNTERVFIHNVDNPFVNYDTLDKLLSQVNTDAVIPTYNNQGGHPILISKNVVNSLIAEKKNDLIFSDFLKRFDKIKVAVDDKNILTNINTLEIYRNTF